MHFKIKLFCLAPFFWSLAGLAMAQVNAGSALTVNLGGRYITLLDEQATPVLYKGAGPTAAVQYQRTAGSNLWQFAFNGGKLAFQPVDRSLRFYEAQPTGFFAGMRVSRLSSVVENEMLKVALGPSLQQEMLVDFEGIGNWPYAFVQGGIFARGRLAYRPDARHRFEAGMAVPLFSWLTDMPYQQIPRVEGRAPDLFSLAKTGTRFASWGGYQRLDVSLVYSFQFHNSWQVTAVYEGAWFHDAKPRDLWAWQASTMLGITRRF